MYRLVDGDHFVRLRSQLSLQMPNEHTLLTKRNSKSCLEKYVDGVPEPWLGRSRQDQVLFRTTGKMKMYYIYTCILSHYGWMFLVKLYG